MEKNRPIISSIAEVTGWSIHEEDQSEGLHCGLKSINLTIMDNRLCFKRNSQPIICGFNMITSATVSRVCIINYNKR